MSFIGLHCITNWENVNSYILYLHIYSTFKEEYTFPKELQEKLNAKHVLIISEGKFSLSIENRNYIIKNIPIKG